MIRAHLVPSCYLAGFGTGGADTRTRALFVIRRDKTYSTTSGKACRSFNYYTTDPSGDDALFREQEAYLSRLVASIQGNGSWKPDASRHLWLLKARTRAILEKCHHRVALVEAAKSGGFNGGHAVALTVQADAPDLVTSDAPVITISGNGYPPARTGNLREIDAMLLPVSPRCLVIVLNSDNDFTCAGELSCSDVEALNLWQAKQAIENLIAKTVPPNVTVLQGAMPNPLFFPSGIVPAPGGSAALFNFHSVATRVFRELSFVRPTMGSHTDS